MCNVATREPTAIELGVTDPGIAGNNFAAVLHDIERRRVGAAAQIEE